MSKRKRQLAHATRRASLRYGFPLTKNDNLNIVRMIIDGKGRHLERQSNRVSVWEVEYNEQKMKVVYDRNRKVIVTCLPMQDMWDPLCPGSVNGSTEAS